MSYRQIPGKDMWINTDQVVKVDNLGGQQGSRIVCTGDIIVRVNLTVNETINWLKGLGEE